MWSRLVQWLTLAGVQGSLFSNHLRSCIAPCSFILNNDVVSPLLTPHILTLHVYLLMMSEAPVLDILICVSSLYSGLEILHQREGLITEVECGKTGCSSSMYDEVMVQIILAKSISESLKICEICEQYRLLLNNDIKNIKGVSVCDLFIIYFKFMQFSMKW